MFIDDGYLIMGVKIDGQKFRPSDWVDRIASTYAGFEGHRIQYHPLIRPTQSMGQRCLFIDNRLVQQEPDTFHFIMKFAESNQLQIVEPESVLIYSAA